MSIPAEERQAKDLRAQRERGPEKAPIARMRTSMCIGSIEHMEFRFRSTKEGEIVTWISAGEAVGRDFPTINSKCLSTAREGGVKK